MLRAKLTFNAKVKNQICNLSNKKNIFWMKFENKIPKLNRRFKSLFFPHSFLTNI